MHRLREEAWVVLDGLDKYAISSYGRVLNLVSNRELMTHEDPDGYLRVKLYKQGKFHWVYLHRLVALAFFVNYNKDLPVYFKNGNKHDCTVLNLTLDKEKAGKNESRSVPAPGRSIAGDA